MGDRMEKSSLLLIVINGAILLLLGGILAFLFTQMRLTGWPILKQGYESSPIMLSGYGETAVTEPFIHQAIGELGSKKRMEMLNDQTLFEHFLHDQVVRRAILTAARDNKLQEEPTLSYRMRKAAEEMLIDEYLRKRLDAGISENFPYEGQMREFYKKNQALFSLKEQLHAWQIFFTLPRNASNKETKRVTATAQALAEKLKTAKISFSDAAIQYSEHESSRSNGGYLGVFEISQLFPVLRKALLGLNENAISEPIRSDTGIHILKRGTKIPARNLSFEQAREKIRAKMRTAALDDLRKKVLADIYESRGEPVSPAVARKWRMELRKSFAADVEENMDAGDNAESGSAVKTED
ncbi:MAG: peptidylprolyl isomerase [Gammaproteobacteria bacterium]|nr:peptidylprolyl isomerase [Gammaproteobacteria bacterium]NNJ84659.1 peptidylprolyl isomerase [Gammaproteobacteria bacterium]